MPLRPLARALLLLAVLPALLAAEPPPAASPYPGTYTPEEWAALERALHAGNLTPADLTFRKDLTQGTYGLATVRDLLRDPLRIAPVLDDLAAVLALPPPGVDAPERDGAPSPILVRAARPLLAAHALLHDEAPARGLAALVSASRLLVSARDLAVSSPTPQESAVETLRLLLARAAEHGAPDTPARRALRLALPGEMLMREVIASGLPPAEERALRDALAAQPADYVATLAAALFTEGPERQPPGSSLAATALRVLDQARRWPTEAFPQDRPLVVETEHGRIALGTPGADLYEGDFTLIVDPGGDDRYRAGRFGAAAGGPGAPLGALLDLGGDDVYDCGDVDVTLGAALLGVGLLLDLGQGDDRYTAGHLSLGAAVGGVGLLYDDGGSDVYAGKTFTQGAAGYGVGVLFDDARQPAPAVPTDEETKDPIAHGAWDNDRLGAWCTAQGFSRTLGVGLCVNERGNDVYEAGGVYLHAPLFSDRYQSFSQGFSIGAREHDVAGGVAALVDRAGNDRYLGDIYNQGVGYWYAAGLLWDGGGNDLYEMTQYGQGSGIHLAVGGLVDVAGSDAYVMHSGLGQGGSHDYAGSILHDRGGNDRYDGNTSCNGCGLTNSVGLHLDRAGDDTYAARRDGGFNAGRPARGFGSVGVLLDLAGRDDYLGPPAPAGPQDDRLWRGSDVGLGLDLAPPNTSTGPGGGTPAADQPSGRAEIPAVCRYEGPLTPAVFDELWAIAVRWEVGDNRTIVPEARKRLIAFGPAILPLLDGRMEKDESGLELRAYADILGGLEQAGAREGVLDLLGRNLRVSASTLPPRPASPEGPAVVALPEVRSAERRREALAQRRRKVALHLVGERKARTLEGEVVALLDGPDEGLARRAAGVLGLLGSTAGHATLLRWLEQDEARVLAALGTLLGSEADVREAVRPLLGHPLVTVRTRLATLLAEQAARHGPWVLDLLTGRSAPGDLSPRAVRTLLDAVLRARLTPRSGDDLGAWATSSDWGLRADTARVLVLWTAPPAAGAPGGAAPEGALRLLEALRQDDDPYVRRCATP